MAGIIGVPEMERWLWRKEELLQSILNTDLDIVEAYDKAHPAAKQSGVHNGHNRIPCSGA